MTPYASGDGWTIYKERNHDVFDFLSRASTQADCILTDPPYNVSNLNGAKGVTKDRLPKQPKTLGRRKKIAIQGQFDLTGQEINTELRKGDTGRDIVKAFGEWDYDWSAAEFLNDAFDVVRDGGQLIAFTSEFLIPDWLQTPFDHRGLLFWKKSNPAPSLPGMYLRPIEIAVYQTKGSNWTFNGGGYTSPIYEVPSISGGTVRDLVEPRVHPTQKPQELWRRLIAVHTNPGDLIVDPFMGSGSCVRAAYDMGRRVIGIDMGQDDDEVPWAEHATRLMRQVRLPL